MDLVSSTTSSLRSYVLHTKTSSSSSSALTEGTIHNGYNETGSSYTYKTDYDSNGIYIYKGTALGSYNTNWTIYSYRTESYATTNYKPSVYTYTARSYEGFTRTESNVYGEDATLNTYTDTYTFTRYGWNRTSYTTTSINDSIAETIQLSIEERYNSGTYYTRDFYETTVENVYGSHSSRQGSTISSYSQLSTAQTVSFVASTSSSSTLDYFYPRVDYASYLRFYTTFDVIRSDYYTLYNSDGMVETLSSSSNSYLENRNEETITFTFPMVVSDSSIKLSGYNTYYSSSYDISGNDLRVYCSTSSYYSGSDTFTSTTYSNSSYFTTYVTLSDNYSLSLYSTMSSRGNNNFYNNLLEFEEEDTITYINRDGAVKLYTNYYIKSYGDLYKVIVSDKFDVGRWYSFTSDKVTSQYSEANYYSYNYNAYHATALTSSTYGSKYTGGNFYTVSGINLTMNGTTYWYEDYEGDIDTHSGEVDDYRFGYVESYYLYTNASTEVTSSTSSELTSYTSLVNSSENHVGNLIYISSVIGSISESRYSTVNAISQVTTGDNLLSYTAVLSSNETVETISSIVSDYATGSSTISYTTTFTPIEVASTGIYVSKPYLEDQFKNYNEYKNPRIQQSVSTIVEDMFEGLEFDNHKVQYDTDPIELDYVSTYSVTIEE